MPNGSLFCSNTRPSCVHKSDLKRGSKLHGRYEARSEDVNYRASRGLDRALFLKLASNDWIRKHRNCLIVGPAGLVT